jgi:hypothetical protein
MRGVAAYLLVLLRRDLNTVCTASIVALAKKLEISRCLLDVRGVEAERSLLEALVHVTEKSPSHGSHEDLGKTP